MAYERNGRPGTLPNTTGTPDEFYDLWMPYLNGAEWKIVSYLIRKTYGWRKESDQVSLRQMRDGVKKKEGGIQDLGTGLSESTILETIKRLTTDPDPVPPGYQGPPVLKQNTVRPDGSSGVTTYALNLNWVPTKLNPKDAPKNGGGGSPEIGEPPPDFRGGVPRKSGDAPVPEAPRFSGSQQTVPQQTVKQQTAAATCAREEIAGAPPPSAASEPLAAAADHTQPSESDPMTALLGSVGIHDPLVVAELSTGRSLEEMRYRVEDVRKRSKGNPGGLLIHTIRAGDAPPEPYLRHVKREHAAANREVVTAAARGKPPGEGDPTAYQLARSPIGRDERPARAAPEVEDEWRLMKSKLKIAHEKNERERMAGEEAQRAKALRLAQQAAGMAA